VTACHPYLLSFLRVERGEGGKGGGGATVPKSFFPSLDAPESALKLGGRKRGRVLDFRDLLSFSMLVPLMCDWGEEREKEGKEKGGGDGGVVHGVFSVDRQGRVVRSPLVRGERKRKGEKGKGRGGQTWREWMTSRRPKRDCLSSIFALSPWGKGGEGGRRKKQGGNGDGTTHSSFPPTCWSCHKGKKEGKREGREGSGRCCFREEKTSLFLLFPLVSPVTALVGGRGRGRKGIRS